MNEVTDQHEGEPPFNLLAEQSALGAMLLSRQAVEDVLGVLDARDYYYPKHEVIHEAITAVYDSGEPVDVISVSDQLMLQGKVVQAGGVDYLHVLTSAVPSPAGGWRYAKSVADIAVSRRLISAGQAIIQLGMDSQGTPVDLVDRARKSVEDVADTQTSGLRSVGDILPDLVQELKTVDPFVPTPWAELDAVIGGFRKKAVYGIGARPGIGKTVIGMQMAVSLSCWGKVAFCSLEMGEQELVGRLLSSQLGIHASKVQLNKLTDFDYRLIADRGHEIRDLDIVINDRASMTISDIRQFARSVQRKAESEKSTMGGVVIDYLQLMGGDSHANRQEQIASFSRSFKLMSKEFQCPVIVLSQLNRGLESRADPKPKLSDFRESGAIEQDLDVAFLLSQEEGDGAVPPAMIIDVAKNRHGATKEIRLDWEGMYSRAVSQSHRTSGNQGYAAAG